jgi:Flp pilus assembly protein TadD
MDWSGAAMRQARRELAGAALLACAAFVVFLGTRALARHEHQLNRDDAAAWYATATAELDHGRIDAAIAALRRASSLDRDEREYSIALGRALAEAGRFDHALRVLESLRTATPGDPRINLALARVAAGRSSIDEAVHYYHSAIYGTWQGEAAQARTDLRLELTRLLLASGRRDAARSELAALDATAPDNLANHLAIGALLLEAGDEVHAYDAYRRALSLSADDPAALAGAGRAAFAVGRYAEAHQLLRRANSSDPEVTRLREAAGLVISINPLAPRLGPVERKRRVTRAVSAARDRVQTCLLEPGLPPESRARLGAALAATALSPPRPDQDEDAMTAIESALAHARRLEEAAEGICPGSAIDAAILVVARRAEQEGG